MQRREMIQAGVGVLMMTRLTKAWEQGRFDSAAAVLQAAVTAGQLHAAALFVQHGDESYSSAFGTAAETVDEPVFLLASITKPITVASLMTLYDEELFGLDDPVVKFLPEFTGDGRESIRMRQLLTHVSGLPDQLPENDTLRAAHAGLDEFVDRAMRTPLLFAPGTRFGYSSMAILLASEVAQRISGMSIAALVEQRVLQPLEMSHSALGLGQLPRRGLVQCQVERAALESGGGQPSSSDWDWNSDYWRQLGAPWGGAHGSAADVARFLQAFLVPQGKLLRVETSAAMIRNQNPPGLRPRGLGFDLGGGLFGPDRPQVFGHSGSTGTLCWADPKTQTACVVLTSLPAGAVDPHPRQLASRRVAEQVEP